MPYIKQETREELSHLGEAIVCTSIETAGELNYLITCLCNNYMSQQNISYQTMNDIVGALEGAKLEFYARIVRPYEDKKIQENGDVY